MKYIFIILALIVLTSCSTSNSEAPPPFLCIHPAIRGGAPFVLPEEAKFGSNGLLHFKAPDGADIMLVGTICIRVGRGN